MSNALAIAGTSAVLQHLLNGVLNSAGLGNVSVTAVAPDIAQSSQSSTPGLQVNLFLHQVTPNAAWRNIGLPSRAADGKTRLQNEPLALDLHYLLTAYGTQNYEAEALLGHAVHTLHRTPVLSRSHIQDALNALNPSLTGNTGLNNALESAGLADQVEMLKVTPATLGREEMAWLWTALKADYRPTFPFQVTVVLIQARNPTVSALPVLQRAIAAQPNLLSPLPTLTAVTPPNNQPAASPGDVVIVTGVNLSGVTGILLANSRLGINPSLASYSLGGDSFQFTLPKPATMPPSDIPAGVYLLSAQVPTANGVTTTNSLPFAVAPTITTWPTTSITRDTHGNALVPITCAPSLRPGQEAYLLIGGQSSAAATITASTNSPTFNFIALQPTPTGQPAYVRLRVDGVDSPIIDLTKTPPVFFGPTVTVT